MVLSADPGALRVLLERHEIGLLVLFGSRARGTPRPTSDTDLAVLATDERPLSFRSLGALVLDLERLAKTPVDLVDLAAADALLRFEVLRDGRILYVDDRERLVRFAARTLIDHDDVAPFLDACIAGVGRAARRAST
jgi:predicted nucleotidyltransferase